jgi:small subunit ribosomal protein S20
MAMDYFWRFYLANHKSAAKRARQSVRKAAVNGNRKNTVRTHEKKLLKAIQAKNVTELPQLLKNYISQLAKAAQKGVFKKETASRKIGQLASKVNQSLQK